MLLQTPRVWVSMLGVFAGRGGVSIAGSRGPCTAVRTSVYRNRARASRRYSRGHQGPRGLRCRSAVPRRAVRQRQIKMI